MPKPNKYVQPLAPWKGPKDKHAKKDKNQQNKKKQFERKPIQKYSKHEVEQEKEQSEDASSEDDYSEENDDQLSLNESDLSDDNINSIEESDNSDFTFGSLSKERPLDADLRKGKSKRVLLMRALAKERAKERLKKTEEGKVSTFTLFLSSFFNDSFLSFVSTLHYYHF